MEEESPEEDFQCWWKIPSIVHFCKMFSLISKDVFPVDITEFERAIETNSDLLTNMAIRFTKICGFYDPNSDNWWNIMKKRFKEKCIEYNYEYSLDSVTYFDYLTRKQKVDALYIMCHIILDVKNFQNKIALRPEIWKKLNIKPLGSDLNKSLYWYFGSTRLYREDFEDMVDLSINSSISNNTSQFDKSVSSDNSSSSNIDLHESFPTDPSPSGHFRSGKWHIICNDNNASWHSLADVTEHSNNINIRSLHRSICDIIQKLPQIKRDRSYYKYLKAPKSEFYLNHNTQTRTLRSMIEIVPVLECNKSDISSEISRNSSQMNAPKSQFSLNHNIQTRSLRSMIGTVPECNKSNTSSEINSNSSPNAKHTKSYDSSLISQPNKRKNNTNMCNLNRSIPHSTINVYEDKNNQIERSPKSLRSNNISTIDNQCENVKMRDFNSSHLVKEILKYDVRVNVSRFDQENNQKFDYFKEKLRTSKRFKTESKIPPFKDLNS